MKGKERMENMSKVNEEKEREEVGKKYDYQ